MKYTVAILEGLTPWDFLVCYDVVLSLQIYFVYIVILCIYFVFLLVLQRFYLEHSSVQRVSLIVHFEASIYSIINKGRTFLILKW